MTESADLSGLIAQTDVEMQRLGWTPQQGKEFLIQTYGKQARTLLTKEELLDFLRYLQYLPTPDTKLDNPAWVKLNSPNTSSSHKTTPINLNQPNKNTKTVKTTIQRRKKSKNTEPIDLSDVIAKTDLEMERLGWTPQQGREYLIQTYGKRGRTLLTEEELLDFLQHLESKPTPPPEFLGIDPLAGF